MATQKFNVVLDGIELSKAQQANLNKEIQALVTSYVAKVGNDTLIIGKKDMLKINPEWLGIWLRKFKDTGAIKTNVAFNRLVLKKPL